MDGGGRKKRFVCSFRAIGVSNYEIAHLEQLMKHATVQPMVNQIEVHPRFPNKEVRAFCKENGEVLKSVRF